VPGQQQERPHPSQLHVTEAEPLRPGLRQLLIQRDGGFEVRDEHARQNLADIGHARHNSPSAPAMPAVNGQIDGLSGHAMDNREAQRASRRTPYRPLSCG
jgi:hypothetical protein